jgi:hypothetical protein
MSKKYKRSSTLHYRQLKSGGYVTEGVWNCDTDIKGYECELTTVLGGKIRLNPSGLLTIRPRYHWDGMSGPVIDRKSNMHAGLAHDAFFHLLRAGLLPPKVRKAADALCRDLVKENGGWAITAWVDYVGLRIFGGYAAKRQIEVDSKIRSV